MSGKSVIRIFSLITASALLTVSAAAQTSQTKPRKATLDAFSVWQTEGQIVPVSMSKAVVTGTLGGPMFIESDYGPEDSGDVACPATIEIDLKTGYQVGQGYCTFTAYDEAKVFGSWRCEGTLSEGCDGQFTITGGTKRLASITGKSDISFFASRHDLRVTQQTTVADKAGGITIWPGLSVTLRQAMTAK